MTIPPLSPSRRKFIKSTFAAGALLPLAGADLFAAPARKAAAPKVYIFSKHLQFLNYDDMAAAAMEMGFDGVDLTVRPNGHVLPERVPDDLPRAAEAIKKAGATPFMMTTAVDDANDPIDRRLLETASKLGFRMYRMNWLSYPDDKPMPQAIEEYVNTMKQLGELNSQLQLNGFYQNHSGLQVGASMWELWQILKEADKEHLGVQYDIRHAMVEGGESWQNGLRLIHQHIKALTIKDFKWGTKAGKWGVQDVPMGEGMIDFKNYVKLLRQYGVDVPISLHIEYPLGGVEHGATKISIDKKQVFAAMKKDLQFVKRLWNEA